MRAILFGLGYTLMASLAALSVMADGLPKTALIGAGIGLLVLTVAWCFAADGYEQRAALEQRAAEDEARVLLGDDDA